MSFDVPATSYGRFMGRFSEPLATLLADAVRPVRGQRALDVGCGPGALTAVLVERLGADRVAAIDPSVPFVAAARDRLPGVDVRHGVAEDLPWADRTFDVATAELVVHFMTDPVRGLAEMRRVTTHGGTAAACVWDHGGGTGPLSEFWRAVHDLDPGAPDEAEPPGSSRGQLGALARAAGFTDIDEPPLTVEVAFRTFEDWWEPFTLGVGPAGDYVGALDAEHRQALVHRCREILPSAPFTLAATAWTVLARG